VEYLDGALELGSLGRRFAVSNDGLGGVCPFGPLYDATETGRRGTRLMGVCAVSR
jgi:hypothetical protein